MYLNGKADFSYEFYRNYQTGWRLFSKRFISYVTYFIKEYSREGTDSSNPFRSILGCTANYTFYCLISSQTNSLNSIVTPRIIKSALEMNSPYTRVGSANKYNILTHVQSDHYCFDNC